MIHSADTAIHTLDVGTTRPSARSQRGDFSRSLTEVRSLSPRAVSVRSPNAQAKPPSAASPVPGSNSFVRSAGSSAPGKVPRFDSVPESAQWPHGPYKQAPEEFGGEWWLVNPFSGPQPWVRAAEIASGASPADPVQPSDDFLKLFGTRPGRSESSSRGEYIIDTFVWDRELANFGGVGIPDGFTEEQVQEATKAFEPWGMGEPVFYKSRDGWVARFPDSQTPDFQMSPETAIKAPQVTVAVYQVRAILHGVEIENRHPLVPSDVWPLDRYKVTA